ncbi:MAG: O-antigen ligase domain-containing protein [Cytophagia bacterium]|nr:O-antigen ligase domain-containing protein [Cytophagia bacterium]
MRFLNNCFGAYYLLYFSSFLAIYFFLPVVPVLNIAILVVSYFFIIQKKRFDVVIALIFYSRCLNGFVIFHNQISFQLINLITNVLPILLYFFIVLNQKEAIIRKSTFYKYKFTLLFFALLTMGFLVNFITAYDLITKRFLPLAFFILFLFGFNRTKDFDADQMLRFFRSVFSASIIVFFFSDYLNITRDLMESDMAFSIASGEQAYSLTYFSFTRNMGPSWDHRIFAILAYLYLLLSIVYRSRYLKFDIAISFIVVVTTLSRGAILTYLLILAAYFFIVGRKQFILVVTSLGILAIISLFFLKEILPDQAINFLETFNPTSRNSALDQRRVFADYAMKAYLDDPIMGKGIGFVTSLLIERSIYVDGVSIAAVTDAFWYSLLAEMGLIGFLLYVLFLKEVFLSKSVLMVALFVGFSVQLLGTDIPDMRFYYFGILVLGHLAKRTLSENKAIFTLTI